MSMLQRTDFAALAKQYGSDATKDKGGDLGTFGYDGMVADFRDFTFTKPVGTIDVIRTQFGYHVVEVQSQSGRGTAVVLIFPAP